MYSGRGKKRVLVEVLERTAPKSKPKLLMDDVEVKIGVKRRDGKTKPMLLVDDVEVKIGVKREKRVTKAEPSPLRKTWSARVGGGMFDALASDSEEEVAPKQTVKRTVAKKAKGAWGKSLMVSAAEKHGSTEAWATKSMKSYEEVLSDAKSTLESELAQLKAAKDDMKKRAMAEESRRRASELAEARARLEEAEAAGDWGDMVMEEEALAAIEAEIAAVWGE